MSARRRTALLVGTVVLSCGGSAFAAWPGFTLVPTHSRSRPVAVLSPSLSAEVARELDVAADADEALRAALRLTGRHLHFGLNHRRSDAFGTDEREAHCVEYAHLAGALLSRWSRAHGDALRVTVVRSQARLFGRRVPMRGWSDHDWVLVEGRGRRWLVDPTFDDMGLGWDLEGNVVGLRGR